MADKEKDQGSLSAISDIAAAIVLSIAALVTSWAGFQAALWDGEQAAAYTRASTARVQASLLATENGQYQAVDLFLFTQWLNAYAAGDESLQQFYRGRFRPEFARAFDAWLALRPLQNQASPRTPFAMREYAPKLASRAASMDARADALFEQGQRCNEISDSYVGATATLALALFLGGIGQTFNRARLTLALTVLAALACGLGLIQLISLPSLSI